MSIIYTLTAVAKCVDNGDNVVLGINLTDNNMNEKDNVRNQLSGSHTVIFYNNMGDEIKKVTFNIDKTGVFYQGWCSYLSEAIDGDTYEIKSDYVGLNALIIDEGRRTLDLCFIGDTLSPRKTKSYDFGLEKFFLYIKSDLHSKYGLRKETHELENIIMNNKTIKNLKGEIINKEELISSATEKIANDIKNCILEDFGSYSFDKILFAGGGALMFADILKQLLPEIEIFKDPVFTNAIGLNKLMVRKFIKNLKGM
jgi:hypothetical protein